MKIVIDTVNPEGMHQLIELPVSNEEVDLLKRSTIEKRKDIVRLLVWRYMNA